MAKKPIVKLSPPWDGYMSMLASFFKGDNRIRVGECAKGVGTIEVFDTKMYVALGQVLRTKLRFGNVKLEIRLVPANGIKTAMKGEMTDLAALKYVLSKNPAFAKIISRKTAMGNFVYVLFKPEVLLWYNDNLASPYKQSATVYEQAALTVFVDRLGVSYATEPARGAK